jgi:hypothetical protein
VVFLQILSTGETTLLGFGQGKYRLIPNPATGLTQAVRQTQGSLLVPSALPGRTLAQALRSGAPERIDWGVFRRRILRHVAAQEGNP